MAEVRDVVIVGAGPSGMAAAIYLQRAGRVPLLLDMAEPGGLLLEANLVENYPGFPGGIRGKDLAALIRKQTRDLGVTIAREKVSNISLRKGSFLVKTDVGVHAAHAVIVATGTRPRKIRLKGGPALEGKKLFYSVSSLLESVRKGADVLVIGGGDAAFDYALNIRGEGCKVTIISRSRPRSIRLLQERAERAGIEVQAGLVPVEARSANGRVLLKCVRNGRQIQLVGDCILSACGREPNLELLERSKSIDSALEGKPPATGTPGMFLIGDVVREDFRQTGIAVGDGILAAMLADRYIGRRRA